MILDMVGFGGIVVNIINYFGQNKTTFFSNYLQNWF